MSPFITLLTAIKKLLTFKVDRDEFRDVIRDTKNDIEGIKNDIEDTKREIEDVVEEIEGNIAQSDWNQNDETAPDYVKNRTHFEVYMNEYVLFEGVVNVNTHVENVQLEYSIPIGTRIRLFVDGTPIDPIPPQEGVYLDSNGSCNFDPDIYANIYADASMEVYHYVGNQNQSLKIVAYDFVAVRRLDEKYLPKSIVNVADTKMDKNNPVGTGSFSMNRKTGSSVGGYSTAMGYDTTASGSGSTAMGFGTKAFGDYSHASGRVSTASGYETFAHGDLATASGDYSFAIGVGATASGEFSTAIGHWVTAASKNQLVHGRFNITDNKSKYLHIIGNGNTGDDLSNAHTLDWNGLGWFAGGLKVGGTGQDDENAKEVATKDDKLPNPNALTFTGAVEGTYDGSAPMTVEIPEGGAGGEVWELVSDITLEEDVITAELFSGDVGYKKLTVLFRGQKSSLNTGTGAKALCIHTNRLGVSNPLIKLGGAILLDGYREAIGCIELRPYAVSFYGSTLGDSGSGASANVTYSTVHNIAEYPVKVLYASGESGRYYMGTGTRIITYGVRA